MRTIKFRAWDKDKQEMVSWEELRTTYASFLETPNDWVVEVMQFTGLYDRNKKPIFEGDICKYKTIKDDYKMVKIEWSDGGFISIYLNGGYEDMRSELSRSYEVIGNIWENPDLLPNDTQLKQETKNSYDD